MKCEKCLSRTNCQFLGAHKKAIVEDCTAFRSEEQYIAKIRSEAIKESFDKLKTKIKTVEIAYGEAEIIFADDLDKVAKEMGVEL